MSASDYRKEHFNSGAELKYAERKATLAKIVARADFIKIDTDGHDLRVLHGAEPLLKRIDRPLALIIETDFHGDPRYGESSFAGVDEFMRDHGYTLLDMSLERYERAALPRKFKYGITASTERGPIGFADVTYVDDPLSERDKLGRWLASGLQRFYKLLALYDLLGFSDCAAELILALSRHPASSECDNWTALIGVLDSGYAERIAAFRADPKAFT